MLVAHRPPLYPHPAWDVMMMPTPGRFSAGVSFVTLVQSAKFMQVLIASATLWNLDRTISYTNIILYKTHEKSITFGCPTFLAAYCVHPSLWLPWGSGTLPWRDFFTRLATSLGAVAAKCRSVVVQKAVHKTGCWLHQSQWNPFKFYTLELGGWHNVQNQFGALGCHTQGSKVANHFCKSRWLFRTHREHRRGQKFQLSQGLLLIFQHGLGVGRGQQEFPEQRCGVHSASWLLQIGGWNRKGGGMAAHGPRDRSHYRNCAKHQQVRAEGHAIHQGSGVGKHPKLQEDFKASW